MNPRNRSFLFPVLSLVALVLPAGVLAVTPAPQPPPEVRATPKPFEFTDVMQKARELALKPYQKEDQTLPEFLARLDAEQYHNIRYKPDKALWADEALPFRLETYHRGSMFRDRISINIVDKGTATPLAYSPELFDFGVLQPPELPANLGFAGLRLHYPLHRDDDYDEVAFFLGNSFFRARGLGQVYGLSARGLAIDTGLQKAEEFPVFREFWVEKPAVQSGSLTLYALLDSPSLSGAYRFVLHPGLDHHIEVSTRLYFRKTVERLGIAPLNSMFFHGENTDRFMDDARPEVHDSDGLLLGRSSGEWVFRPLNNPRQLRISVFRDSQPSGFGLLTRDRNFDHYQDIDANYQQRPGAWVETLGNWGDGAVYLIEIPSDAERYDNISAFWVPDQPIQEGRELAFDYRLHFSLDEVTAQGSGKVVSTRIGKSPLESTARRFMVDFASPSLKLLGDRANLRAEVTASSGKLTNARVEKNEVTDTWRLSFDLQPEPDKGPVELRAMVKSGEDTLTETWVYQWNAP